MKELIIETPRSTEAAHTSNLDNKININKKGNIILPCGYYDTG